MLELLLMTYKDMFGEDFPIADFAGTPEIDVINILYDLSCNFYFWTCYPKKRRKKKIQRKLKKLKKQALKAAKAKKAY